MYLKILASLFVALVVLFKTSTNAADADLWGYLAFGRLFFQGSAFPYQDVFAYTPTYDIWVYHEWLTGVVYYFLYDLLGMDSLQLLKHAISLTFSYCIFKTARLRGANFAFALVAVLLGSFALSWYRSVLRAQYITMFFFILFIYILEKSDKDDDWRPLVFLMPLMLLWCNFHGGFLVGFILLAGYALNTLLTKRSRLPVFLLVTAGCLAATLLNPYGLDYWKYLIMAVSMPRPEIGEWKNVFQAFATNDYSQGSTILLAELSVSLYLIFRFRSINSARVLILTVFAFFGLTSVRHQCFYMILFAVYCSPLLNQFFLASYTELNSKRSLYPAYAFVLIFLIIFYGSRIWNTSMTTVDEHRMPYQDTFVSYPSKEMLHMIETEQPGVNIFCDYAWGEYLLFHLPNKRVSMDGRYETVYTPQTCQAYFDFMHGKTNELPLKTELAVLFKHSPAARQLDSMPEFSRIFEDDYTALWIKTAQKP